MSETHFPWGVLVYWMPATPSYFWFETEQARDTYARSVARSAAPYILVHRTGRHVLAESYHPNIPGIYIGSRWEYVDD